MNRKLTKASLQQPIQPHPAPQFTASGGYWRGPLAPKSVTVLVPDPLYRSARPGVVAVDAEGP